MSLYYSLIFRVFDSLISVLIVTILWYVTTAIYYSVLLEVFAPARADTGLSGYLFLAKYVLMRFCTLFGFFPRETPAARRIKPLCLITSAGEISAEFVRDEVSIDRCHGFFNVRTPVAHGTSVFRLTRKLIARRGY